MADKDQYAPTVKWGESGYYENWLVGNESGFSILRDAIDEMLKEESDALMPDSCDCDFRGLSISADYTTSAENYGSGWLLGVGCFLAFGSILGLVGLGVWKLIELLVV